MTQFLATLIPSVITAVCAVFGSFLLWRANRRDGLLRAEEARRNDLRHREEAALERALSNDLTRQQIGLIQLRELKDSPSSSPQEAEYIQKIGDRALRKILGQIILRTANGISELAQEYPQHREGLFSVARDMRSRATMFTEGGATRPVDSISDKQSVA